MKNGLEYLTWEHVEVGVCITGCDKSFEGALEGPVLIDRRPVVEIGETAFADCKKITSVASRIRLNPSASGPSPHAPDSKNFIWERGLKRSKKAPSIRVAR